MSDLQTILNNFKPSPNSHIASYFRNQGIPESEEFKRIRDLPRRISPRDLTSLITNAFKTSHGTQTLRLEQAFVLTELFDYRGCFAPLKVGAGKTLISLLAGRVMNAQRTVILVPAALKRKTEQHDIPEYMYHWKLPETIIVISYEALQQAKNADILFDIMPDLIVADEVHYLRNRKAARTKRFERFFEKHPEHIPKPPLLAMSGTITKRSIKDYWHIIKLCLPDQCPLPLQWNRLKEWADAVDADVPDDRRVAPGALLQFCRADENVRQGFGRRIRETPGVVYSNRSAFGDEPEPGLEIFEVDPGKPPIEVINAFDELRRNWETPGGEEIYDALSAWRHAGSLAMGFYLKWAWPEGSPTEEDKEWMRRRKDWHRFVRDVIRHNRRQLDSELQVFNACCRGDFGAQRNPQDVAIFNAWCEVKDRPAPPTEAVWITDWLLNFLKTFERNHSQTKVYWVRSPHLGEKLADTLGVPYFGAGQDSIITYGETCVASIRAHGTGKNLQQFSRAFFVQPCLGGQEWEQTLGRMHRPGQQEDVVENHILLHCRELYSGFQVALNDARYIQETTGNEQKLLEATLDIRNRDLDALAAMGDPLWS